MSSKLNELNTVSSHMDQKPPPSAEILNMDTKTGNSSHELKNIRFMVYKNLLITGLAWIFLFTAYTSMSNLQSSLNQVDGLGTASLSAIYVALIVSCLFLPTILISKLGVKWTIFFSILAYVLFILANIYPQYYTLLPSAIILGFGAAPLWTAKCAFLTDLGSYYAKHSGQKAEVVINRFFGIFFAMFQSSSIWGNIISSTVLRPVRNDNETLVNDISYCGINDCPGSASAEIKKPVLETVYILCGIYVTVALIGAGLIFFFLNTYKQIGLESKKQTKSPLNLLLNTIKHIKNSNQLLIIPLTLWSGFEQAFISADFTKSYISCIKGIESVGIIMICYGVSDTIGSYGFGYIIKYLGRIPCFVTAACLNLIAILIMLFWKATPDNTFVLYLIAVIWGLGDAVWQTQINSFYGVVFESNEEAAFSNYRLWESLGFAIAYAYSNFLCVRIKVYLLIGYLLLGMLGYGTIEIRLKYKKKLVVSPMKI